MKWYIRADNEDNRDHRELYCDERVWTYTSENGNTEVDPVEELIDRGGGFLFNEEGTAVKFVAPIATTGQE